MDSSSPSSAASVPSTVSSNSSSDFNVDSMIERLLAVRGSRLIPQVHLTENEIIELIRHVKPIIAEQPMLLELSAPVKICGKDQIIILSTRFLYSYFLLFIFIHFR